MLELKNNANYLHRLTPLFGIAEISQVISMESVKRHFIPVLQALARDRIPNVRMNVAKTISLVRTAIMSAPRMTQAEIKVESELLKILDELKLDSDNDVKFYTKKAISMK